MDLTSTNVIPHTCQHSDHTTRQLTCPGPYTTDDNHHSLSLQCPECPSLISKHICQRMSINTKLLSKQVSMTLHIHWINQSQHAATTDKQLCLWRTPKARTIVPQMQPCCQRSRITVQWVHLSSALNYCQSTTQYQLCVSTTVQDELLTTKSTLRSTLRSTLSILH